MPSSGAFDDSVRCCCRTHRSCWISSFSAFNDLGCTTVCSGVVSFCFGHNKHLCTSRYLVLILLWIGWYSTQPINTHAPKRVGNTRIPAGVSFVSYLRVRSAHNFVKVPPVRNTYPRSHGTHSSPFPSTERAFALIPRKKCLRIKFPSLASPCVELVCILCNLPAYTQRAGCEALSAVSLYTDAFVSGLDLDPTEHTCHTLC